VHETNRVEGPGVESTSACCLSCDEEFVVDRNMSLIDAEGLPRTRVD
jgi:hypothetical protein